MRKENENNKFYDRSVIVSAITLSILSWKVFDYRKLDFLIDFLTDFEDHVWQKALSGIILSLIVHQNRLQRFPKLIKRLQTLQEIEKVQIGIFLIDTILRNQLYKNVIFPEEINKHEFLSESPYNWFFPFYENNKILSDSIENTEQDIDVEAFLDFIHSVPLVGALKYVICNKLKDGNILFSKENKADAKKDDMGNDISSILNQANYLSPYHNLISEVYLYFIHYPKDRVKKLFETKITLAQTKLKNIILSKTQALKLAANLHFEKKQYNSCISKLKELLNIEPNQLSALILISQCYENKKEFSNALSYLFQAEKLKKNNNFILFQIGFCLNKNKQYKKSNEYLLKADKIIPNSTNTLMGIGNNYFKLSTVTKLN